MCGWIKLHRNMLEWEWYGDPNTSRLFLHMLLKVNHQPKKWRGLIIERGQLWTSLDALSDETGLSKKSVRTAIDRLKSTGELADKGHSTGRMRGRMITVLKYDFYQGEGTQTAGETAGEGHTSGTQRADKGQPLKNVKNDKNDKNVNNKQSAPIDAVDFSIFNLSISDLEEVKRIRIANKGGSIKTQRVANGLATEIKKALGMGLSIDTILTEWETRKWKSFKADWMGNSRQGYAQAGKADRAAQLEQMDIEAGHGRVIDGVCQADSNLLLGNQG